MAATARKGRAAAPIRSQRPPSHARTPRNRSKTLPILHLHTPPRDKQALRTSPASPVFIQYTLQYSHQTVGRSPTAVCRQLLPRCPPSHRRRPRLDPEERPDLSGTASRRRVRSGPGKEHRTTRRKDRGRHPRKEPCGATGDGGALCQRPSGQGSRAWSLQRYLAELPCCTSPH